VDDDRAPAELVGAPVSGALMRLVWSHRDPRTGGVRLRFELTSAEVGLMAPEQHGQHGYSVEWILDRERAAPFEVGRDYVIVAHDQAPLGLAELDELEDE
jgi:hypothetical protein